ncbi:MAG: CoA transferase [Alphaproteobacteria bacterium]|nr:CoA transferase [Alphaproteobacteria bacterium]
MTTLSKDIVNELLGYASLSDMEANHLSFKGMPIAHNLKFPIDEIIAGVQSTCGLLVSEIWRLKSGEEQKVTIDMFHSYLSFSGIFFVRQNGYDVPPWDPKYPTLGLYKTRDEKHIFINGGYPTLRDKILRVLGTPNEQDLIAAAMLKRDAFELEEAFAEAATCGAVVREKNEWLTHPQGMALNRKPPLVINKLIDTEPEKLPKSTRPLEGLKVVDFTQAIAAPACGRYMAEYGADVLHITAPHMPSIPAFSMDTGHGKRQAFADLKRPEDLAQLKKLLSEADVFIEGWRPNVMAKYGLTPEEVQKIRPGIIHVTLSCYGTEGPWKDRAGWEQLGQAVSGIIDSNAYNIPVGDTTVKVLSETISTHGLFICDYLSGNLATIGVLSALLKRHHHGGGYHIHIALTRSGMWAISKPATTHNERRLLKLPLERHEYEEYLAHSTGPYGTVEYLAPAIRLSKTPPMLNLPISPNGSSRLEWI